MKTTVFAGTSLDGFIAGKVGDTGWLDKFANDESLCAYNEFIDRIDAIVIGSGTFQKVLTFPSWPYEKSVFVLSKSIHRVPESVKDKVTVLSMKPGDVLRYLAGRGFSSVYVDGGRVIQDFLMEDLIDELIISTAPVIIGSGIALFGQLDKELHFRHVKSGLSANGLVRNHYVRQRNEQGTKQ